MNEELKEPVERIIAECKQAGATEFDLVKLFKLLSKENNQELEALRTQAVVHLEKINPEAGEVYKSFQRLSVVTSRDEIVPFNRGNIVRSLLKETSIPRGIAESIGKEIEDKIKDLKINFLSSHMIRALVNSKLLELNQEKFFLQYARLGLPVFNVSSNLDETSEISRQAVKEFTLFRVLKQDLRTSHFKKELVINAIEDFPVKMHAAAIQPEGEFNETELLRKAFAGKKFSLPLCFNAVNYFVEGHKKENAEKIIKAMNLTGADYAVQLFSPDGFRGKEDEPLKIANYMLREGKDRKVVIDSSFGVNALENALLKKEMVLFNSKNSAFKAVGGKLCSEKNVLISLSLSTEKIIGNEKEGRATELIAGYAEKVLKIQELKKKELGKRSYFEESDLDSTQSILIVDLINASRKVFNKIKPEFVQEIAGELKKRLGENWILFEKESMPFKKIKMKPSKNINLRVKTGKINEVKKAIDEGFQVIELN